MQQSNKNCKFSRVILNEITEGWESLRTYTMQQSNRLHELVRIQKWSLHSLLSARVIVQLQILWGVCHTRLHKHQLVQLVWQEDEGGVQLLPHLSCLLLEPVGLGSLLASTQLPHHGQYLNMLGLQLNDIVEGDEPALYDEVSSVHMMGLPWTQSPSCVSIPH